MANGDTKERIFDAAERLFIERGFAGASLRAVTREAGVNLAAVHYHFGSKEALLGAVLERHFAPLNRRRLELLDKLEANAAGRPLEVEDVLETFLSPLLEYPQGSTRVRPLFARLLAEPRHLLRPILGEEFKQTGLRYFRALQNALPGLPVRELLWRFQFVIGATNHLVSEQIAHEFDVGQRAPGDTLQRLVAFLAAGMRTTHVGEETEV